MASDGSDKSLEAMVARIDERTLIILDKLEGLDKRLTDHEEEDHDEFKEVNDKIAEVKGRQNYLVGGAALGGGGIVGAWKWIQDIFNSGGAP